MRKRRSGGYNSWANAIQRCTNPSDQDWARYGGRGIKMCERWRLSSEAFMEDMGPRPPGATLDRIDSNGDYEPGNCRWASFRTQRENQERNVFMRFNGQVMTASRVAEALGIHRQRVLYRLRRYGVMALMGVGYPRGDTGRHRWDKRGRR